jgi:protein gp88
MPALRLKWSTGNEKLKKLDTISFNLPAFKSADGFKVCPQAGACATVCYARQGRYIMPTVAAAREYNLAMVRRSIPQFVRLALADLANIRHRIVRIHDSGDFFSQAYLDAWFSLARAFPAKRFYAYTKSLHLDWSRCPENFQRIQSMGGLMDGAIDRSQSHSRIFASVADRKRAGYVDGNENDQPAIDGVRRIGLVYHGTRSLKAGQVAWLREAK